MQNIVSFVLFLKKFESLTYSMQICNGSDFKSLSLWTVAAEMFHSCNILMRLGPVDLT